MIKLFQPFFNGDRPIGNLAGLAVSRSHENASEGAHGTHHKQAHGALVGRRRHGTSLTRGRQAGRQVHGEARRTVEGGREKTRVSQKKQK
uniref:Uncharacterized protein n=1 Tax=Physcomitrium patens TaxID=3218 RepID=A0A2K1K9N0_PHYPA|nr:hypothetical protein PHYPA_009670 [Physcomitrium patens]